MEKLIEFASPASFNSAEEGGDSFTQIIEENRRPIFLYIGHNLRLARNTLSLSTHRSSRSASDNGFLINANTYCASDFGSASVLKTTHRSDLYPPTNQSTEATTYSDSTSRAIHALRSSSSSINIRTLIVVVALARTSDSNMAQSSSSYGARIGETQTTILENCVYL